jgi:hypothetical protein
MKLAQESTEFTAWDKTPAALVSDADLERDRALIDAMAADG